MGKEELAIQETSSQLARLQAACSDLTVRLHDLRREETRAASAIEEKTAEAQKRHDLLAANVAALQARYDGLATQLGEAMTALQTAQDRREELALAEAEVERLTRSCAALKAEEQQLSQQRLDAARKLDQVQRTSAAQEELLAETVANIEAAKREFDRVMRQVEDHRSRMAQADKALQDRQAEHESLRLELLRAIEKAEADQKRAQAIGAQAAEESAALGRERAKADQLQAELTQQLHIAAREREALVANDRQVQDRANQLQQFEAELFLRERTCKERLAQATAQEQDLTARQAALETREAGLAHAEERLNAQAQEVGRREETLRHVSLQIAEAQAKIKQQLQRESMQDLGITLPEEPTAAAEAEPEKPRRAKAKKEKV